MAREKTAGVIGGMGPEATAEFFRRVVAATPARDDADHLHVLIDNNPKIPSRIEALIEGHGEDPAPALSAMAQGLERAGADFLVIPCNTAHHYLPAIARAVSIPVLDMVALSVAKLAVLEPRPQKIGMLASPAVRLVGLYDWRLREAGFAAMFPDTQGEDRILAIIRAVKANRIEEAHRENYLAIANAFVQRGADAFLIACTELSILGLPGHAARPAVDALDALVAATIEAARAEPGLAPAPCLRAGKPLYDAARLQLRGPLEMGSPQWPSGTAARRSIPPRISTSAQGLSRR